MSTPSGYWTAYNVGGAGLTGSANREDLLDVITNLDKEKTAAMFQMLPKTTANYIKHEWLTDTLDSTATGGAFEGDDFAAVSAGGRTRLANFCQIFRRDFAVSNSQIKASQNGQTAGVANEYEYTLGRKLSVLAQDVDARIVANTTAVASVSGGSATARVMGAARAFSITVTQVSGAFATASFFALHQSMYTNGANPNTLVASPGVKAAVTQAFMGNVANSRIQYNQPMQSNSFEQAIDVVVTDFGRILVFPDRFVPASAATQATTADGPAYFLFDKSKLRLAFFRPIKHVPLPPNGDAQRGFCAGELTLEVLHPSAIGIGNNVTS